MIHKYFAAGSGQFPDDMLRYDQATVFAKVKEVGTDIIGYMIESNRLPTQARWQSFLWATAMLRSRYRHGNSEQGPIDWEIRRGETGTWQPFHYIHLSDKA